MTIQEAIKSEKPVKRKDWAGFIVFSLRLRDVFTEEGEPMGTFGRLFTVDDILADDWEVKEECP